MPVKGPKPSEGPASPSVVARHLFAYADQDLHAARRLADDPAAADRTVGFHAQQAVEKYVKAVLHRFEIPYSHTHDLNVLLEMLRDIPNMKVPVQVDGSNWLTPWAVAERYPTFSRKAAKRLDRARALKTAMAVRSWAARWLDVG